MKLSSALVMIVACVALAGCADTSDTPSMRQRQDAALKDPFSYSPNPSPGQSVQHGTTPEPAMKPKDDSLKGEWNRFWNP